MPPWRRDRAGVLCDQLLYLDISWTEIEDLFLARRAPRERKRKSMTGLVNAAAMDEQSFRRLFRFEKDDLPLLKDALRIPEIRSSQGVKVTGEEALLMGLRRLAYPNRWWDLEPLFGRHASAMSSIVGMLFSHIDSTFGHLLDDLNNHSWLRLSDLEEFSKVSGRILYQCDFLSHMYVLALHPFLCFCFCATGECLRGINNSCSSFARRKLLLKSVAAHSCHHLIGSKSRNCVSTRNIYTKLKLSMYMQSGKYLQGLYSNLGSPEEK